MKNYNRIMAAVIALIVLIFAGANLLLKNYKRIGGGRPYRVEVNRIALEIKEKGFEEVDLSKYQYVTAIQKLSADKLDFYNGESDYMLREIDGEIYRLDYFVSTENDSSMIIIVNIILGVMSALIIGIMLFIRTRILSPFDRLRELPYELSRGNLTLPIKESKSRFFGRFLWGVDLLRENLEQQKQRELALQKEKKTLLLSLSHDIKTPLAAIKLYTKALSKGLYTDKKKQLEIVENINKKADEIEDFITQIIKASREDFLELEVNNGEFYLSELMNSITLYYKEKLSLVHVDFCIEKYCDCILKGDVERSIEVLQNIIENAVKYGDGKCIDILFDEEEGCQLVIIKNSGCTLPDTELLHIFDSFWRGSNSEGKSGSGLGLYICRQLMNKMGGEIFAEISKGYMTVTVVFSKV